MYFIPPGAVWWSAPLYSLYRLDLCRLAVGHNVYHCNKTNIRANTRNHYEETSIHN